MAGVATDYCVRATALDAIKAGFPTTVVTDAVAAVDVSPGTGAAHWPMSVPQVADSTACT